MPPFRCAPRISCSGNATSFKYQCIHDKAIQSPKTIKEQGEKHSGRHTQVFPKQKLPGRTWKRSLGDYRFTQGRVRVPEFGSCFSHLLLLDFRGKLLKQLLLCQQIKWGNICHVTSTIPWHLKNPQWMFSAVVVGTILVTVNSTVILSCSFTSGNGKVVEISLTG